MYIHNCDALSSISSNISNERWVYPRVDLGTLNDVSPIAFGTLNADFSNNDNFGDVLKVLPPNTLTDTAEIYGDGAMEVKLSDAIVDQSSNDNYYVGTKFAPLAWRRSKGSVIEACKASLQRLKCSDKIDLYQMHYADRGIFGQFIQDEQFWDGLASCYHDGLVANVGVCNYGPTMMTRVHQALTVERGVSIVSNQINFSLSRFADPSVQQTLEVCSNLQIPILAYSPLANGLLSNPDPAYYNNILKSNPDEQFTSEKSKARRMKWYLRNSQPLLQTLQTISNSIETDDASPAQVALNWCLSIGQQQKMSNTIIPIVGTNNVNHAKDALNTLNWKLTDSQIQQLNEAAYQSAPYARGFILR